MIPWLFYILSSSSSLSPLSRRHHHFHQNRFMFRILFYLYFLPGRGSLCIGEQSRQCWDDCNGQTVKGSLFNIDWIIISYTGGIIDWIIFSYTGGMIDWIYNFTLLIKFLAAVAIPTCCCVIGGRTFFKFGRFGVPKFTCKFQFYSEIHIIFFN